MGQALDLSTYMKVFEPYSRIRLPLLWRIHKHVKLRRELGQISSSFFAFFWHTAGTSRLSQVGYKWEACLSSLMENHVAVFLNMNLKGMWSPQRRGSRCEGRAVCSMGRWMKYQWAKENMVLNITEEGGKEPSLSFPRSWQRLIPSAAGHIYKCRTVPESWWSTLFSRGRHRNCECSIKNCHCKLKRGVLFVPFPAQSLTLSFPASA